jgi:NADP-dependent 3-hydroxy acid dehydrogenase YdfG
MKILASAVMSLSLFAAAAAHAQAGFAARAVAFAMSQPWDVDIDEILYRPTRQEF